METKKKIYIWIAVIVAIIVAFIAYDQISLHYHLNSTERINKKYEKRMDNLNKDYEDALRAIDKLEKHSK